MRMVTNASNGRLDEQSDSRPIPKKLSSILIPGLVGIGVGSAAIFGLPVVLGALGFQGAGIAAGSFAAWFQATVYGGVIPAGGWFATCQAVGVTGVTKGTAFMLGTMSSGVTHYWRGSDSSSSEEKNARIA